MICPACKRPIPTGQQRCPACSPGRRPLPKPPPRNSSAVAVGIIVALAVVAGGAYWALRPSEPVLVSAGPVASRDPLAGLPAKVRDPKAQLGEDQDTYLNVEPGAIRSYSLEADRHLIAVYDVTPTDGTILAAAMKARSIVSMTPEELGAFEQSAVEIRKGTTRIVHCEANNREQVGLFLKNKGTKPVNARVRKRWWGLEEQAPEPAMEVKSDKDLIPPGEEIEMLIVSDRRTKGLIEIIPSAGTISAALIALGKNGDLDEAEMKKKAESQLRDVTAPGVHRLEFRHNIGESSYCLIRNRGDKFAAIERRLHTGLWR